MAKKPVIDDSRTAAFFKDIIFTIPKVMAVRSGGSFSVSLEDIYAVADRDVQTEIVDGIVTFYLVQSTQ